MELERELLGGCRTSSGSWGCPKVSTVLQSLQLYQASIPGPLPLRRNGNGPVYIPNDGSQSTIWGPLKIAFRYPTRELKNWISYISVWCSSEEKQYQDSLFRDPEVTCLFPHLKEWRSKKWRGRLTRSKKGTDWHSTELPLLIPKVNVFSLPASHSYYAWPLLTGVIWQDNCPLWHCYRLITVSAELWGKVPLCAGGTEWHCGYWAPAIICSPACYFFHSCSDDIKEGTERPRRTSYVTS